MIPLGEQLADVYRLIHRSLVRRLAQETPRPWTQLKLLRLLHKGGASTQAALAERLMLDAPAVSRLVSRLEGEGLLVRREGGDRRCQHLELTEAATAELEATRRALVAVEERLERLLSEEERAQLRALLAKLHAGLRAESASPTQETQEPPTRPPPSFPGP